MSEVTFQFSDGSIDSVESYTQLNLLAHAQLLEKSLQSRCGGHCECSTCRVVIVSGRVSAMKESEKDLLKKVGISSDEATVSGHKQGAIRLSCQCFPEADVDVVIEVPAQRHRDARV